jgi:uncharacterized protein YndB with AHSA1/START domain
MDEQGRVEIDGDIATVTFERFLAASPARVWDLLTSREGLGTWLAPSTMETHVGGTVVIDFGEGERVTGRVMEWEPQRRLAYTWLIAGERESVVEWELRPEGAGTVVSLTHRSLPEPMGLGYGAGWHAHLDRLVASATDAPIPDWDERFQALIGSYRSVERR